MAFKRVPLTVTLGQQYNIGEKPTVVLYTYINRHAGTPEKQRKTKKYIIKHGSNNILLQHRLWRQSHYNWNENREGHDVDIFIIQKVQHTVIHLEVDEEQWEITKGSKRQARWVWSPRTMSGLRLPDTPHAQHQHNDPRIWTGNKRRSI